MSGYDEYTALIAEWAPEYMKPIWEDYEKGVEVDPSAHKFFNVVFYGYKEIADAFDTLRLSEALISVAPPRSKKVPKDEYVRYVVNTYLQEVYILKERLNSYATKLKRMYEKSGRTEAVANYIGPIFGTVKSVLDGIVNVRGVHVHSRRYSDEELARISHGGIKESG